jgi:hypothetical protein
VRFSFSPGGEKSFPQGKKTARVLRGNNSTPSLKCGARKLAQKPKKIARIREAI